ncbi:hypothetical protein TNCV_1250281 [Trichonephila clavipes]|nr:hypothetical protein TNCV_1250281 [Trichonephila clavipes]
MPWVDFEPGLIQRALAPVHGSLRGTGQHADHELVTRTTRMIEPSVYPIALPYMYHKLSNLGDRNCWLLAFVIFESFLLTGGRLPVGIWLRTKACYVRINPDPKSTEDRITEQATVSHKIEYTP